MLRCQLVAELQLLQVIIGLQLFGVWTAAATAVVGYCIGLTAALATSAWAAAVTFGRSQLTPLDATFFSFSHYPEG